MRLTFVPSGSRIPQIWSKRLLFNIGSVKSQGVEDMNLAERSSELVVYVKFVSANDQAKLYIRGYSR